MSDTPAAPDAPAAPDTPPVPPAQPVRRASATAASEDKSLAAHDPQLLARRLSARLKMRHLQLLLLIQQHGSLTRAAEQLATSQPAITNTLSELEALFGAPLFDRSSRGMAPTPLGHIVLARASVIINDLGHLVHDVQASGAGLAARLQIGATPFVSSRVLCDALTRLQQDTPRLAARIHQGTSAQLLIQLRDHSLDAAIGRADPALNLEGLDFERLYLQPPRLIANRRLAAQLSRRPLDWQALAEFDWILGAPGTPMREEVAGLFLRAGITPPLPLMESHSTELIGTLIAGSEQAISIVPADIANELVRVAGVAIVPYTLGWQLPPIALFTRRDSRAHPNTMRFAAALRDACGQMQAARPADPY